ncbi:hypothetical protein FEM48_Zijuj05G0172800 [Ziziphus jujuba var. spinosa]|uniref:YqaJ viral recombinase domain-containing protein n=1 Tax=Ziziphus jujuba var. spinosa TaxID=714518 RepID=A0A978VG40_ZIZJJ|nr:hypothetical protein FEM48_Zijuj05G0172800 [Ziziphus jujuba var. spinosa]
MLLDFSPQEESTSEKEALEFCKRSTGNTVLSPEFQDGNADKNPGDDWLGASLDGIVYELPLRSHGLVQIKCPYFFKPDMDNSMASACPWWWIALHCIPQAQEYWNVLKMALCDFWWKHVQPAKELCDKSVIKKPLTESRSFRPADRHELYRDIYIDSKRIVDSSKLLMQEIGGDLRK